MPAPPLRACYPNRALGNGAGLTHAVLGGGGGDCAQRTCGAIPGLRWLERSLGSAKAPAVPARACTGHHEAPLCSVRLCRLGGGGRVQAQGGGGGGGGAATAGGGVCDGLHQQRTAAVRREAVCTSGRRAARGCSQGSEGSPGRDAAAATGAPAGVPSVGSWNGRGVAAGRTSFA
jgi:hypothetical protein